MKTSFGNFENHSNRRAEMMMHNCTDGMQEPLYGFTTQIDLVKDEECQFNISCDANGNKIQTNLSQDSLTPRESSQYHASTNYWRRGYYNPTYNNLNRQTGEEFASSGPPRCRARRGS